MAVVVRNAFRARYADFQRGPRAHSLQGTKVDDWPGRFEFKGLGVEVKRTVLHGKSGAIELRYYEDESQGGSAVYAASSRPHVVGLGENDVEALADWTEELTQKWEMVKNLRRPFAPAIENDVEAMGAFFGFDLDGNSESRY